MTNSEAENLKNLISLSEAIKLTGYHQDYLGFLCREGKLKGFKIGRNWVIEKNVLDDFLKLNRDLAKDNEKFFNLNPNKDKSTSVPVRVKRFLVNETEKESEGASLKVENKLTALKKEVLFNIENRLKTVSKNLSDLESKVLKDKHQTSLAGWSIGIGQMSDSQTKTNLVNQSGLNSNSEYAGPVKENFKNSLIPNIEIGSLSKKFSLNNTPSFQKNISKFYQSFTRLQFFRAKVSVVAFIISLAGFLASVLWAQINLQNNYITDRLVIEKDHSSEDGLARPQDRDKLEVVEKQNIITNNFSEPLDVKHVLSQNSNLIYSLIDNRLNQYLAEGKFKGEKGDAGLQGLPGINSIQGTAYQQLPQGWSSGTTAVSSSQSQSGTIGSFTYLSAGNLEISANSSLGGTATLNNLIVNGSTTLASLSVTNLNAGFTTGSVVFQGSSALSQDNSNFYWDDTNNILSLGTTTIATSSILQLESTDKGFLAPRMTTVQRDAIISPATGLLVYNLTTQAYNFYNGSSWSAVGTGSGGGSIATGTPGSFAYYNAADTNIYPQSSLYFSSNNIGIGTSTPGASLVVQGTSTLPTTDILRVASSSGAISLVVTAGGNVGIGTSAPSSALAVNGGIFQYADANKIRQISTTTLGTLPSAFTISGRYAYVVNQSSDSLSVVDISNPYAPVQIATTSIGSSPRYAVVAHGNYVYLTNNNGATVSVIDVSNPYTPTQISSFSVSSAARGLAVSGHYLYVASFSLGRLYAYDISDPYNPRRVGEINSTQPFFVDISGRYAYVTNFSASTLSIYDISNPSAMVLAGTANVGGSPRGVKVSGRYAFVGNNASSTVSVVDISNPSSPTQVSTVSVSGADQLFVSGRNLYVGGTNGVSIFDISAPENPVLVDTVSSGNSSYPYVSGKYLYSAGTYFVVTDLGGIDAANLAAGSAEIGNLQVTKNLMVQGNITANTSLFVGGGGIFSNGALAVSATNTPSYFGGQLLIGTTSTTSMLTLQSKAGVNPFSIASSTGTQLFTFTQAGNLGIGTATPLHNLDVVGTVRISTGDIYAPDNSGVRVRMSNSGVNTYGQFQVSNLNSSPLFTVLNSGLAGIGSSSPVATLSVVGTSTLPTTDILKVASSSGSSYLTVAASGLTTINQLTVNGTTTLSAATTTINGVTYYWPNALPVGNRVLQSDSSGNLTWVTDQTGGGGSVSGGLTGYVTTWSSSTGITYGTLIDNGTVAGINATSSTISFNLQGSGTLDPFNVSSSSGTSILNVKSNLRVGIASSTPTAMFVVQGTNSAANTTTPIFVVASSTGSQLLTVTSSGNVGIGTSTPQSYLHVAKADGSDYVAIIDTVRGISANNKGLLIRSNTSLLNTTPSLMIQNNDGSTFMVANNGQVGIGTSAPDSMLDIHVSNKTVPSLQISALDNDNQTYAIKITDENTNSDVFSLRSVGTGAALVNMYVSNKVSVGTTSTSSMLTLQSAAGVNPLSIASSSGADLLVVTSLGNVTVATLTASSLVMSDGSKNLQSVTLGSGLSLSGSTLNTTQVGGAWTLGSGLIYNATSTDLVGIGTITPTTTLFVQGKGGTNPFVVASSTGTALLSVDQNGSTTLSSLTVSNNAHIAGAASVAGSLNALGNSFFGSQTVGNNNSLEFNFSTGGTAYVHAGPVNTFSSNANQYWLLWGNTTGTWVNNVGNASFTYMGVNPGYAPVSNTQLSATGFEVSPTFNPSANTIATGRWVGQKINPSFGDGNENYNATSTITEMTALEIAPTINVRTTSTAAYIGLRVAPIETSVPALTNYVIQAGTSTNTSMFVLTSEGKVGIATSTPSGAMLVVNIPNSSSDYGVSMFASNGNYLKMGPDSSDSYIEYGSGKLTLFNGSGGTVNFMSDNTTAFGTSTTNSRVSITGTAALDPFNISSTTGTSFFKVTSLGNVTVATLTASSLVMSDGNKNLQSVTLGSGLSLSGSTLNTTQAGGAWTIGSGLIYNATSTDLVGIGTITPTTTLFVQGKGGTNPFAIASSTGTQLLTVTQAGNVGIGTSTPRHPFVIASTSGAALMTVATSGVVTITRADDTSGGGLLITPRSGGSGPSIAASGCTTLTIGNMLFACSGGITVQNTSMTFPGSGIWTSSGSVGIGTSTPASRLQVVGDIEIGSKGSTTASSLIFNTGSTTNQTTVRLLATTSLASSYTLTLPTTTPSAGQVLGSNASGELFWNTVAPSNANAAWTIGSGLIYNATSTDLVGIGTITPTTTLFVQGKAGTNPFAIASSTGTQLLTVTQAGNVGIGTSTPSATLQVQRNTTGPQARFFGSNYTGSGILHGEIEIGAGLGLTGGNSDTYFGRISYVYADGNQAFKISSGDGIALQTNPAPGQALSNLVSRLVVAAGGNVGITTTTPTAVLHVQGIAGSTNPFVVSSSTGSTLLAVLANGNVGIGTSTYSSKLTIQDSGTSVGSSDPAMTIYVHNVNGSPALALKKPSGAAGAQEYRLGLVGNGNNQFVVYDATNNRYPFAATPNSLIGINSTTPTAMLTVQGNTVSANQTLDLFRIATSSGSIYLNVTSQGNVGINTTTPPGLLTIAGTAGSTVDPLLVASSSGHTLLSVSSAGTVTVGGTVSGQSGGIAVRGNQGTGASVGISITNSNTGNLSAGAARVYLAETTAGSNMYMGLGYYNGGDGAAARFNIGNTNIGSYFVINTSNSGTGIGQQNDAPLSTLHVKNGGASGVTGLLIQAGSGQGSSNLVIIQGNAAAGSQGTTLTVFNSSGFLGIGTTTPASPIQVVGNIELGSKGSTTSSSLVFNTGSTTNQTTVRLLATTSLASSYTLTLPTTTPSAGQVLGSTVNGELYWANASAGSIDGTGATGLVARWSDADTLTTGLLIDNGAVAGINATSSSYTFNLQGSAAVDPFNISSSSGTSLFVVKESGKVGIGTTTPGAIVHIHQDASSTLNSTLYTVDSTTPVLLLGQLPLNSATSTGTYFGINAQNGFRGNLMDLQNNGRSQFKITQVPSADGTVEALVGINSDTSAPLASLDVHQWNPQSGTYRPSFIARHYLSGTLIQAGDGSGTAGIGLGYNVAPSSGTSVVMGYTGSSASRILSVTNTNGNQVTATILTLAAGNAGQTGDYLQVNNSSGSVLTRITSSGAISIGSSTPVARLTVMGTSTLPTTTLFTVASSSGAQYLTVSSAGNVGVGTSTPIEMLHIQSGNILLSNQYSLRSLTTTGANAALIQIDSSDYNTLYSPLSNTGIKFKSATASDLMTILNGGNIGIGTSTPEAKLVIQNAAGTTDVMRIASSSGQSLIYVSAFGGFVQNISSSTAVHIMDGSTTPASVFVVDTTNASGNAGLDITAGGAQTGNLLNFFSSGGAALLSVTAPGGLVQNVASTTAFQLQNGSGSLVFNIDTVGKKIGLGTSTGLSAFDIISDISIDEVGSPSTGSGTATGLRVITSDDDSPSVLIRNTSSTPCVGQQSGCTAAVAAGSAGILTIEASIATTTATSTTWQKFNFITAFASTTRSAGTAAFRVRGDGAVFAENAYSASGADYAEYFDTFDTGIEAGDIVIATTTDQRLLRLALSEESLSTTSTTTILSSLSTTTPISTSSVNNLSSDSVLVSAVMKSTKAYDSKVLGIVSSQAAFIGNNPGGRSDNNPFKKAVGLVGRVPVKVTNENGEIKVGDFVTTSGQFNGYGMKATRSGYVLGVALEDFKPNATSSAGPSTSSGQSATGPIGGTVLVFINPGYQTVNNTFVLGENDGQIANATSSQGVMPANAFIIDQRGSGNILQLQKNGMDKFVVQNSGAAVLYGSSDDENSVLSVITASTTMFSINSKGDLLVKGKITVGLDTAGTAIIKTGDNQVRVTFKEAYASVPKIVITAQGVPNFFYGVSEKTTEGFIITTSQPMASDFSFDWIAINQPEENGNGESGQNLSVISSPISPIGQDTTNNEEPDPSPEPTIDPTPTPEPTPTPNEDITANDEQSQTKQDQPTVEPTPIPTPEPTIEPEPIIEPTPAPVEQIVSGEVAGATTE